MSIAPADLPTQVPPVSKRQLWALLLVSTAIEVLMVFRPALPLKHATSALFADLAWQTLLLWGPGVLYLKIVEHRRLAQAGVTWGQPRVWLRWLVPMAVLVLPAVLMATRVPSVHAAYPRLAQARTQTWLLVPSTLAFAAFGLGWEFFFRGFLLMGLARYFRGWAILLQAIPCTLLHLGKPCPEVLASFPAALVLGAMAFRTGSIVPAWLLHLLVALVANLGCVFWQI
jgi:uncharacterized protein